MCDLARVAANSWRVLVLCATGLALLGCGGTQISGGDGRLTSVELGSTLTTSFTKQTYFGTDNNSADFYLTDLPESVWKEGGDVSAVTGQLVHIHMYVTPKAGRTPIAITANTASVRWLVLTQGRVAVYGGGGYFQHSGEMGDETLSGVLADSTLRLVHASPGVADRLGPSVLSMSVSAVQDKQTCEALARAFSSLVQSSKAQ
jgi:hypothetical protein